MKSFILAIVLGTAVYQTAVQTDFVGSLVNEEQTVYTSPVTDQLRKDFVEGHAYD